MAKVMRVESGVDRISALPDELVCHILSLVPTKVAVCTCVLSTRWRRLYTLVSSLDFVTDTDDVEKANRFMNFVQRILLYPTIASVERFCLKFHHHIDPLLMEGWIHALIRRNIQELDLCSAYETAHYYLPLPAMLFSCKSLVALKLVSNFELIGLKIPAKVSLPNLKLLHIANTAVGCNGVEKLLSSCPVLDDLVFNNCYFANKINHLTFNIFNGTLKRLTITRSTFHVQQDNIQIVINCPALVYLNIVHPKYYSVLLVAAKSLAEVIIGTFPTFPPDYAYACNVLRETKDTQSLEIQGCIIQSLFDQKMPLPLFNKLTCLKICYCGCLFDPGCLEYLLARCVVLETLVLERKHAMEHSAAQSPSNEYLLQQSQLSGLLCHLKTIDIRLSSITDAEADAVRRMMEFFLINAKVLEKLSGHVRLFPDTLLSKITRTS